jgi:hypothetical protein
MNAGSPSQVFSGERWIVVRKSHDSFFINRLYTEQACGKYASILDANVAAASFEVSNVHDCCGGAAPIRP